MEYKDVKEKYKALRRHCQQLQLKHEDTLLQVIIIVAMLHNKNMQK